MAIDLRRNRTTTIRLNEQEYSALRQLARIELRDPSEWLRVRIIQAAQNAGLPIAAELFGEEAQPVPVASLPEVVA